MVIEFQKLTCIFLLCQLEYDQVNWTFSFFRNLLNDTKNSESYLKGNHRSQIRNKIVAIDEWWLHNWSSAYYLANFFLPHWLSQFAHSRPGSRLVWISIPLMRPVGALLDLLVIASSLSTHLASSLLRIIHFPVHAAKTCPCLNSSTMIPLIVISFSFMRSVPSLMSIIQPLMERSTVITVLLYLLSYKLYPASQELSVFFLLDTKEF